MTVHVISVGVSLRDSLAEPHKSLAAASALLLAIRAGKPLLVMDGKQVDDAEEASRWLAGALTAEGHPGRDAASAARLAEVSEQVKAGQWPARLSAELDTFARVMQGGARLGSGDIAVLISSDTSGGLLSGLWNAVVLAGGKPDRVRYLASAAESPAGLRGRVGLVRIAGLDAEDEEDFRTAMRGLGMLGRRLLDEGGIDPAEPFRFYLSGGFKAAIPYLIGLAEGLRSLPGNRPVNAYVLHEATTSAAIRLPLRYIAPEIVRQELGRWGGSAVRSSPPRDRFLDGYAYEPYADGWRMTAFGDGLCELFGFDVAGLSP